MKFLKKKEEKVWTEEEIWADICEETNFSDNFAISNYDDGVQGLEHFKAHGWELVCSDEDGFYFKKMEKKE